MDPNIDIENNLYPYCLVWTPLPLLSWIIPIIGHTGICTSNGIIHDFAGSEYVSINDMAFGNPYKYIPLKPTDEEISRWDSCIEKTDAKFRQMDHNLITNNCHSHCADALSRIRYKGFTEYNMIYIWLYFLIYSKYVSYTHILKNYLGFVLIIVLYYFLVKK